MRSQGKEFHLALLPIIACAHGVRTASARRGTIVDKSGGARGVQQGSTRVKQNFSATPSHLRHVLGAGFEGHFGRDRSVGEAVDQGYRRIFPLHRRHISAELSPE